MKKDKFNLCNKCSNKLDDYRVNMDAKIKMHKDTFNVKSSDIYIGAHGYEKSRKFGLDPKIEMDYIRKGKLIDVQKGTGKNESKYIFKFTASDERTMHAIILFTPDVTKLINVYDPHFDMSFKWDKKAEKRLYLNSFRSCCVHPEDKLENFNKRHHGLRHKAYDYTNKKTK